MQYIFWSIVFIFLWMYILYPLFLIGLSKIKKNRQVKEDIIENDNDLPRVSMIICAHNEEKVIEDKIRNLLKSDYPKDKLEIIIASDNSTDNTNEIVKRYSNKGIILYEAQERKGRANVQNEAFKTSKGDIIAFSDANSMWDEKALRILVSNFKNKSVAYVTGKLVYVNDVENVTSYSESLYWKFDLLLRKLESKIHSITAGNGAIYAVKREYFREIDILYSHDFEFPNLMVSLGKRSIFDERAKVFEKAGENTNDEFNRKVRMFSRAWHKIINHFNIFSPFKMGLTYSLFMISHRLFRYASGLLHFILLVMNIFLAKQNIYLMLLVPHLFIYLLAIVGHVTNSKRKIVYIPYYYFVFQYATFLGFFKAITGNVKPFWQKAESTR
ncbi:glycosyltransferase family 2 protein [Pontibacillus marinus]|uniref:Glycosyltransferase family 2 n=2 Tax=Pontibacillus TaxID=289201 RepID=A0A0A5GGA4_9BACI|nr:glycosyltransferase family 2 protein [Pontibacillus marinus]KGX90994.1 glycosyltransferase family 2 [Pontibacillus marinus BH030004 = DSM 16465]